MLRKTLLALGIAAVFGLSLQWGGGGAEAAASSFTVTQACGVDGVGVDVTVNWLGTSPAARELWVDVSQYNNGWLPDTFATSGAISPNQSSFKWVSLLPNMTYYVRVSQLLAPGYWDPSLAYIFQTGSACYGAQTSVFSTPAYGANPYGYGMPSSVSVYSSSTYSSGSSSFSLQPIDWWVRAARAAQFYPPVTPVLINQYPFNGLQPYLGTGVGMNNGGCDPSYPTFCIPVGVTLNCADVLPHTNFPVLAPDPQGFDADNDGIGCEV